MTFITNYNYLLEKRRIKITSIAYKYPLRIFSSSRNIYNGQRFKGGVVHEDGVEVTAISAIMRGESENQRTMENV